MKISCGVKRNKKSWDKGLHADRRARPIPRGIARECLHRPGDEVLQTSLLLGLPSEPIPVEAPFSLVASTLLGEQ